MATALMKIPKAPAREPREPERRARSERSIDLEIFMLLELGFPAV